MAEASPLPALLELASLARLPRTGWLLAGVESPESVAAHAGGACLVALALGPRVRPGLDVDRAVALLAVHDAPEARLSDLPRRGAELLPAGAKREAERRAADLVLGPLSGLARERWEEYAAGETREARFARTCDKLHLGVELVALARAGRRGLGDLARGLEELDASEFAPCEALRTELLAAFHELHGR